jgi:hypothetical protein
MSVIVRVLDECRIQLGRHLPSPVKESFGRNVGFVDANDLIHFGLADAIPVQDWIEDKVFLWENVAARAQIEEATDSSVGEDDATARSLSVEPLDRSDPPPLRVKDGSATGLLILDKDVRQVGLAHGRTPSFPTGRTPRPEPPSH